MIGKLRSPDGDKMALEENFFIETLLSAAVLRDLTEKEHAEYRRPYLNAGEDRRSTLAGPRQLPIEGSTSDTYSIIEAYGEYLSQSDDLRKLFINAEPRAFLVGHAREFVRTWPNLTEITVAGAHFIQEDSPNEIGKATVDWMV